MLVKNIMFLLFTYFKLPSLTPSQFNKLPSSFTTCRLASFTSYNHQLSASFTRSATPQTPILFHQTIRCYLTHSLKFETTIPLVCFILQTASILQLKMSPSLPFKPVTRTVYYTAGFVNLHSFYPSI